MPDVVVHVDVGAGVGGRGREGRVHAVGVVPAVEGAVAVGEEGALRGGMGLVEGFVDVVVAGWVGVRLAEVEERVGLGVGRAPEISN